MSNRHMSSLILIVGCILVGGVVSSTPNVENTVEGMDNNTPLPSREEILSMLDSLTGLSDEDKESLRKDLVNDFKDEQRPVGKGTLQTQQTLLLFSLLGLLALVFLFFGYKLYKSLTERERQRIEKKRIKERRNKNK